MWLYVVLLHETVLLVPNLCLQYLAFQFYEFLKVTGLKFGCDSSKTPILTVFGVLLVIKRLGDDFICVILLSLMETRRLVPWFRQLDLPGQSYNIMNAPRARGRKLLWIQEQIFKSPGQERPTVYQMAAMGLSVGHKRSGPRLNLGVDLY